MAKNSEQTLFVLIAVAIGLFLAAVVGIYGFIRAGATPLHPDTQGVRSVAESNPPPEWADAVQKAERLVRASLVEQNLPGVSVAVGVDGELLWAAGFGWADLEKRVPVAPSMRFRIGAASIPITSAAVGLLLERGALQLDDPIRTHVPEFPEKRWPVTLRQLMAHVAGVRRYDGESDLLPTEPCARAVEGLPLFAVDRLRFPPGTQYEFSQYGWILVSAAVEAAANEPFFAFLRAQVLEPLGMHDTLLDSPEQVPPQRVTYYYPRFNADTRYGPELTSDADFSCFSGAGGLLSTPTDLVRFGLAFTGGALLQPATVDLLLAPGRLALGDETGYALGWDLETVSIAGEPTVLVGHDDELTMGGSTSLLLWPERGIVVAVTANISFADTFGIASRLVETFAKQASGSSLASEQPAPAR